MMDFIRTLLSRCGSYIRRLRLDADVDEELRAHVQFAVEENLRRGMNEREARSQAMRSFGGMTQTRERYREQRGLPMLEEMKRDMRFGFRQLQRSPGFAI